MKKNLLKIQLALLIFGAALLSSCSTPPPAPVAPPTVTKKEPFKMYEWNGDGVPGKASIVIYLDKQKAEFYRDNKVVGWTYVATGRASHPTPSGKFTITEKTVDKVSNLYGKLLDPEGKVVNSDFNTSKNELLEGHQFSPARMPYFLRLTNDGVGLHVGPIPRPGRTASHGCIRVPRGIQPTFFANTVIGTPVTIYATTPAEPVVPAPEAKKKGFWGTLFGKK